MRAVIYTRVSSDTTGRGRSVSEQETECREICAREGWTVAEVLTDNDIGASRYSGKSRPAYKRLVDVLQSGDVLVTWEASRAQRDLKAYVELRELCADRRVLWSYLGRTYDLTKGDDRFTTGLDALLAEKEAEQVRDRVMRAHRANAAAGLAHGRIPYGYRAVRDEHTGKITKRVPHESEAPVVREIAKRILDGDTIYAIAQDFERRGIEAPGNTARWRTQRIREMVMRPTYAGIRVHRGVATDGTWEALISRADHESLKAILTNPQRTTHRGAAPRHLLSGIARCGKCNEVVTVLKSNGYPAYTCSAKQCVSRRKEPVDNTVVAAILRELKDPKAIRRLARPEARGAADDARAEIEVLTARLQKYRELAVSGDVDPEEFGAVIDGIKSKIATAESRLQSTVRSPLLAKIAGQPNADELWEGLTIVGQRELIRDACDITIKPTRPGARFDPNSVALVWR